MWEIVNGLGGGSGLRTGVVFGLMMVLCLVPVPRWTAAWASGAWASGVYLGLLTLIGMRLRRVPPGTVVAARISAVRAGINSGDISEDGTQNPALVGGFTCYGGVGLGPPTKRCFFKLRNVQVVDNKRLPAGNSNPLGNSGITMAGSATSAYDAGSRFNPGGNIFAGNTPRRRIDGPQRRREPPHHERRLAARRIEICMSLHLCTEGPPS